MCCQCCQGRTIQRTRQQLLNGANSHLKELTEQTLQMHNEGLDICFKQVPDQPRMGEDFQQSCLDDDFEMGSEEGDNDDVTDFQEIDDCCTSSENDEAMNPHNGLSQGLHDNNFKESDLSAAGLRYSSFTGARENSTAPTAFGDSNLISTQ